MPVTTIKQPVCCARRTAKLTMDRANLGRLAQKAAAREQKNLDITALKAKIEECKAVVEADKQAIIDHEAEHAGGML
jgi:wobble nucleotide-excising tRNase